MHTHILMFFELQLTVISITREHLAENFVYKQKPTTYIAQIHKGHFGYLILRKAR